MDCKTARHLLELERPWHPELAAEDALALRGHLADCPDCAAAQRAETRMDEALGRAMRAVPVPEGLPDRILGRLAQVRNASYRRRLFLWAGAAAAAVLLGTGGWAWWRQPRLVNLDEVADEHNAWPRTAEGIDDWFGQRGVATRAPRVFNYGLLTYCDQAAFQGRLVPMIQLSGRDGSLARIYILDAARFDLDSLDPNPHGSGRFTIQALPPEPPFGYVIEYTGGSLQPFLAAGTQG